MNYKCKFCGYRFKDKDEQICPECLTAREEDISCGIFGEDEHSHERFNEHDFSDGRFVKSDTFKDGRADFLREERREENRADAAKYERRNGGDINVEATPAPRFSANNQQYNYGNRYTPVNTTNAPKNQGCGKRCGCFVTIFVIIIFMAAFVPDVFSDIIDAIDEKINTVSSTSSSTADKNPLINSDNKTEPDGVLMEKTEDCDIDFYFESSKETKGDTEDEGLDMFAKEGLWFYDENGEPINCNNLDVRQIYQTEITLNLCHGDYSKVELDDIDIQRVELLAEDKDGNLISLYEGYLNDLSVISVGKVSRMYPKMYYDANAASAVLYIDALIDGKEVTFYHVMDCDVQS